MTHWLDGTPIPWSDAHDIAEYCKGNVWVLGLRRGSRLLFSVRYWNEKGETVYTEPKIIADGVCPATVKLFLSEKDGYFQLTCGNTAKWIRPQDIKEIPGPPPAPAPILDIEMHALSLHEWMLWRGWDRVDRALYLEYLRETLREARQHRVNLMDFFLFVSDCWGEHEHVNYRTPFRYYGGKFDLNAKNEQFFEVFEDTLRVFMEEGVRPMPQLFMGFGYNSGPFVNNHQGISTCTISNPVTWPYTFLVAEWVCESFIKVFGPDYFPDIKFANEIAHGGDDQTFHDVMRWHKLLWERVVSKYTKLWNVVADVSHSDATRGDLIGPRWECVKPGPTCYSADGWHGNNTYGRECWPEDHGMATIEDFLAPPEGYTGDSIIDVLLGSGNICWRPTEDAGSRTRSGKGETWGSYSFATAEQTYVAARYFWARGKKAGKRIRYALFPIETLKRLNGLPDFRVDQINWERFKKLRQAWEETYEVR